MEDLSRSRKNKSKTKTEGNAKELFILNPDKLLFNGLEIIKSMEIMRADTQISCECIFREIVSRRILCVTLTKKIVFSFLAAFI